MRDTGTAFTLAEYLPLRRDSFGALFFFDLIDAVETLAPPYEHSDTIEWWSTLREASRYADVKAALTHPGTSSNNFNSLNGLASSRAGLPGQSSDQGSADYPVCRSGSSAMAYRGQAHIQGSMPLTNTSLRFHCGRRSFASLKGTLCNCWRASLSSKLEGVFNSCPSWLRPRRLKARLSASGPQESERGSKRNSRWPARRNCWPSSFFTTATAFAGKTAHLYFDARPPHC